MIGHLLRVVRAAIRERSKAKTRSPHWTSLRDTFLKIHPRCAACGSIKRMQVHHIEPFHLRPELELERSNLIGLCMDKLECHLRLGHGDDFRCFNPHIVKHSAECLSDPGRRQSAEYRARLGRLESDPLA